MESGWLLIKNALYKLSLPARTLTLGNSTNYDINIQGLRVVDPVGALRYDPHQCRFNIQCYHPSIPVFVNEQRIHCSSCVWLQHYDVIRFDDLPDRYQIVAIDTSMVSNQRTPVGYHQHMVQMQTMPGTSHCTRSFDVQRDNVHFQHTDSIHHQQQSMSGYTPLEHQQTWCQGVRYDSRDQRIPFSGTFKEDCSCCSGFGQDDHYLHSRGPVNHPVINPQCMKYSEPEQAMHVTARAYPVDTTNLHNHIRPAHPQQSVTAPNHHSELNTCTTHPLSFAPPSSSANERHEAQQCTEEEVCSFSHHDAPHSTTVPFSATSQIREQHQVTVDRLETYDNDAPVRDRSNVRPRSMSEHIEQFKDEATTNKKGRRAGAITQGTPLYGRNPDWWGETDADNEAENNTGVANSADNKQRNEDCKKVEPRTQSEVRTNPMTRRAGPTAFTVDIGDRKKQPLNMSQNLSQCVPNRLRRNIESRDLFTKETEKQSSGNTRKRDKVGSTRKLNSTYTSPQVTRRTGYRSAGHNSANTSDNEDDTWSRLFHNTPRRQSKPKATGNTYSNSVSKQSNNASSSSGKTESTLKSAATALQKLQTDGTMDGTSSKKRPSIQQRQVNDLDADDSLKNIELIVNRLTGERRGSKSESSEDSVAETYNIDDENECCDDDPVRHDRSNIEKVFGLSDHNDVTSISDTTEQIRQNQPVERVVLREKRGRVNDEKRNTFYIQEGMTPLISELQNISTHNNETGLESNNNNRSNAASDDDDDDDDDDNNDFSIENGNYSHGKTVGRIIEHRPELSVSSSSLIHTKQRKTEKTEKSNKEIIKAGSRSRSATAENRSTTTGSVRRQPLTNTSSKSRSSSRSGNDSSDETRRRRNNADATDKTHPSVENRKQTIVKRKEVKDRASLFSTSKKTTHLEQTTKQTTDSKVSISGSREESINTADDKQKVMVDDISHQTNTFQNPVDNDVPQIDVELDSIPVATTSLEFVSMSHRDIRQNDKEQYRTVILSSISEMSRRVLELSQQTASQLINRDSTKENSVNFQQTDYSQFADFPQLLDILRNLESTEHCLTAITEWYESRNTEV